MTSNAKRAPAKAASKTMRKPDKGAAASGRKSEGFTEEERAAMKERAKELKVEARRGADRAAGESAVLAAIDAMPEPDRGLARRIHALLRASAPTLSPRTWYGMPAYARDGKVVCFFQGAYKFKSRYATLGFSDEAKLDEGVMWPTAFALKEWSETVEAKIGALVKKALG